MMYNDDPFLRNQPFLKIQKQSNFIINATNMLDNTNKMSFQEQTLQYKQDRKYLNSRSSASLLKPHNDNNQFDRPPQPAKLIPRFDLNRDKNQLLVNQASEQNLYQLKRQPPQQIQEDIYAFRSKIPSNYPTNKFTYLHEKYGDNYVYEKDRQQGVDAAQSKRSYGLAQKAQGFGERNQALFLGIQSINNEPQRSMRTEQIHKLEFKYNISEFNEAKIQSDQRSKQKQELKILNQQDPASQQHRQKQYTNQQNSSFERFLPDDILD